MSKVSSATASFPGERTAYPPKVPSNARKERLTNGGGGSDRRGRYVAVMVAPSEGGEDVVADVDCSSKYSLYDYKFAY